MSISRRLRSSKRARIGEIRTIKPTKSTYIHVKKSRSGKMKTCGKVHHN